MRFASTQCRTAAGSQPRTPLNELTALPDIGVGAQLTLGGTTFLPEKYA